MKLCSIFFLLLLLGVGAQRRPSKPDTETETSSHKPAGRGRARFSISAEALEEIRTDTDRGTSTKSEKKKVERRVSRPNARPYEVQEIIDDIPNENARKLHKPRVITETRFEAVNAPKKPLFIPVPLPEEELSPEELLASFGPPIVNTNTEKSLEVEVKKAKKTEAPSEQISSVSPINEVSISTENFETSPKIISSTPELTTADEQISSSTEDELKKIPLEIVTPIATLPEPRRVSTVKTHVRPHVTSATSAEETVTSASRNRSRGRGTRRQDAESSEDTSYIQNGKSRSRLNSESSEPVPRVSRARVTRKRLESAENPEIGIRGRGPSILSTASSQELPTRSRTGRKVTSLQGSSSERKEVRAAEEKLYTIRSRRIETKTHQLHFESTNDLSTPASEEKDEIHSGESPPEINRVVKRRRPSHTNADEVAQKSNQSRTSTNRNSRTRNSRNRSAEVKQTTENRRDIGRGRGRKQEDQPIPTTNINNDNINRRANVIRGRKPELKLNINQDINGKINEVPVTEFITVKKTTEIPHTEKISTVESDVLKSESVESKKFINRVNYEPLGSESTTKGFESAESKQISGRSRGDISSSFENKRLPNRSRPEAVITENPTQKPDARKKDVTTEGVSENKASTYTVSRRKPQNDESSTQQALVSVSPPFLARKRDDVLLIENPNSEATTETKKQRIDKNIPKFNSRKTDEIPPLTENYIKSSKSLEQKRFNTRIREETPSTQNVEPTDNPRSRSRLSDSRRNNRKLESRSEVRTVPTEPNSRRRTPSKLSNTVSTETISREASTERFDKFRTRHRTRFMPPIIDEQKLEVLPLFERETKTIRPIADSNERRKINSVKDDFISTSSTEHVVKSATNNEINKGFSHRRGQVVRVETVTEKSEEINIQKRKPIIRESVESEISEGVSTRQFVSTNKTESDGIKSKERKVTIKVGIPKVTVREVVNVSRGNKKAETKSTENSNEDSDNYPEPFKALIQAKLAKQSKKGSRTRSSEESVTKGSEKVMTSSTIKTTLSSLSTQPTAFSRKVEDVDNELIPKNQSTSTTFAPKSTRRRFSLSTKNPLTVDGVASANPLKKAITPTSKTSHTPSQVSSEITSFSPRDSRYHARFASEILDKIPTDLEHKLSVSTTGNGRSFTPKPSRAAYSTRKGNKKVNGNLRNKARNSKPDLPSSIKISSLGSGAPKKPVRFSARYRSDIFSRAGSTRPTPAPVYIPTVPTVTPSSVTQVKSGLAIEENMSGMEVISIDEPVNTIPSDSLVNGELLTPSNPFAPPSNLFPASLVTRNGASTTAQSIISKTAEKPVSIIERIIYSITAISTTTAPDVTIDSITNIGPTKSSAIFKIPNKTTRTSGTTDVTFDETLGQNPLLNQIESSTTEKPTTIIERIISSLSAIQADNSSLPQVGNNVSSISTTFSPLARFTSISSTVSTSLPPDTSPSVDPLVVLEQISSEQSLQERTITKLLELLKSFTTPKQDDVVIVTPKVTSFVSSTPDAPTVVENPDVEVFNVSSNVITNTPEKQLLPSTTTTTDINNNSLSSDIEVTSSTLSSTAPEVVTTTTSATIPNEITSPNISENSIIEENPTTEAIATQAIVPQNLNSRFSQAISLTDYIASLTAKPEITTPIPITTESTIPITSENISSSDNNQPPTSDITTLQNTNPITETSQISASASSAVSNNTEITGAIQVHSVDVGMSTGTPSSVDEVLQTTNVNIMTETTQTPSLNELNATEIDKSDTVTIIPENSKTNTESSQTQLANIVESIDTTVKPNSEITIATESPQISENQVQTTEEVKLATTQTSVTSAINAIESGESNITTGAPTTVSASSETTTSQTLDTEKSNDTVTTGPVNVDLPTTTESITSSTVELPTTLSERLARLMAANLGTPSMVSTTISIEQTSVHNPVTDSDTIATIPQLPTLMNFEVSPGSVTIFSANDISSTFNPIEDGTTVTILSRSFFTTPSPSSSEPSNMLETTTVSFGTNPLTESSNNESVLTTESSLTTPNNDINTDVSVVNSAEAAVNDNLLNTTFERISENNTLQSSNQITEQDPLNQSIVDNTVEQVHQNNITQTPKREDLSSTEDMAGTKMSSESPLQNVETSSTQESSGQISSTGVYMSSESFIESIKTITTQEISNQIVTESSTVSSDQISENNTLSQLQSSSETSVQETTQTLLTRSGIESLSSQNLEGNMTQETSTKNAAAEVSDQVPESNGTTSQLQTSSNDLNQNVTEAINEGETNVTETFTETPVQNLETSTTQVDFIANNVESNATQTDTESFSLNSTENVANNNALQPQQAQIVTNSNAVNATVTEQPVPPNSRAGKLIDFTEPIKNTLDTSSIAPAKDYFIFAVLPNNTIVRKRPNMYPNKDTPFIIVGVYPNNTVVQKFPNGTLIPEEPIIQADNAAQNSVSSIEANQLTPDSTTSEPQPPSVATLPTLSDLLGGKTVQAFNDIINQTNGNSVKVETLDVDPMIQSRGREVEEVNIEENTISSSGNTGPEKIIEATTTPLSPITTRPTSVTTLASSLTITEPVTIASAATVRNTPTTTVPSTTRPPTTPIASITKPPTTTEPFTTRPPTITVPPTTRPPTTTVPTTIKPPLTTIPTNPPTTTVPTTSAKPLTTTLAITSVQSIKNILPRIGEDLTTNTPAVTTQLTTEITSAPTQSPSPVTTQPSTDQTQRLQDMAERDVHTTPVSDVITIPPATLSPRIQEITTIPTRPTTLITRDTEPTTDPNVMTTPLVLERLKNTMPTSETPSVIQRITKKSKNQQRRPTTTLPTTQPPRTRMRTIPTTTVEPNTITMPVPSTLPTSQPIRTTTTAARRYTNTPTTVNTPRRRVTTVPPRIRLTTTPTITEQTIIANNYMTPTTTPRIFEASTVFPVYTRPTVDYNSLETTNPPTTKFFTTFRSRTRQTGSTLPPDLTTIWTTNQNLEMLARLRVDENYGELSTTGDYSNPTTLPPIVGTTFNPATLQTTLKSINSKVRLLTDQQKKDLEELARLEEEQKVILQQLAFLTRLAGGPKPSRSPSNLASRVLDFAAERNKATTDVQSPSNILEALTASNSRQSKKIASAEGKNPTVEEVLKQLNVNPNSVTVSSLSSTYGKSTDAILAALLKEQGIGPNTPKSLGDQLKTTTPFEASTTKRIISTTKKRPTTTARPGPIIQGLNWLLNALGPQPTTSKRPPVTTRRATTLKPITAPFDVELLTNQPTEISPVIVTAPPRMRASASTEKQTTATTSRPKRPLHSLSEGELQTLITQLETIQKDPTKARSVDFSTLKLTESTPKSTTIIANNAVQITNSGKVGSSSKLQLPSPEVTTIKSDNNGFPTTAVPPGVSNSILDYAKDETTKTPQRRPNLPPLKLSPVHGVDNEQEPQIRGQLINAAVNVTKAISQFLGSAIQDAAFQLSENIRSYFNTSPALPTITP